MRSTPLLTLLLATPEDYDGGELVIEDTFGTSKVKLPAGDMVVYSALQPASCGAGHPWRARSVLYLDPEPGA